MAGKFAGKHVFVAGASSGINLGIAHGFAAEGAKVTVLSRSADKIEAAAAGLRETGAEAIGIACDVRDFAGLEAAYAEATAKFGPVDVLISGAAGNFLAPAAKLSANAFKTVVDIDLLGTFNVFRASWDHLVKPGASLIAITAGQGVHPSAFQIHACAAKAGVEMLARTLAIEWGGAGVRVNGLAPGPIDDTEGMRRIAPTPEIRARIEAAVPLGRYGTKDEMADVALFLASPAATYVSGAVWVADGGQSLVGSGQFMQAVTG